MKAASYSNTLLSAYQSTCCQKLRHHNIYFTGAFTQVFSEFLVQIYIIFNAQNCPHLYQLPCHVSEFEVGIVQGVPEGMCQTSGGCSLC